MGDPTAPTRPGARSGPTPTDFTVDPDDRARLSFADGPTPPPTRARRNRRGGAGRGGPDRLVLVGVVAAVLVVALGVVGAFTLAGRSDDAARDDRPLDRGPFDSAEDFVLALHLPGTFTRLAPEDASTFADADYVVTDGDFVAACAGLGQALRDMDPTFPALVDQEYGGGGVNRCEATAPMSALHGATVRALVLKANSGAQIYVEGTVSPTTTSPDPSVAPASPP